MNTENRGRASERPVAGDDSDDRPRSAETGEPLDVDAEIGATEARRDISVLFSRVAYRKERILIARRGTERVAVIPVEDLELLQEAENRALAKIAEEALSEGGESIPWEQVKRELGI